MRVLVVALAVAAASSSLCATVAATPPPIDVGQALLLAPRSLVGGCRRDVRPDARCSPGAISTGLKKRVICSDGFRTDTIRNVPQSLKSDVERAYGMVVRPYGRTMEIDHIVSLELGGSNDIANLFPQPGSGRASYHAKDKLENKLHELVCRGSISLRAAQRQIATDWVALYTRVFGNAP